MNAKAKGFVELSSGIATCAQPCTLVAHQTKSVTVRNCVARKQERGRRNENVGCVVQDSACRSVELTMGVGCIARLNAHALRLRHLLSGRVKNAGIYSGLSLRGSVGLGFAPINATDQHCLTVSRCKAIRNSGSTGCMSLNIARSWKIILEDLSSPLRQFTIRTGSGMITELKTWNCGLRCRSRSVNGLATWLNTLK